MDENYLISRRERKMKLWLLHCAFSDPHTKRFVYMRKFSSSQFKGHRHISIIVQNAISISTPLLKCYICILHITPRALRVEPLSINMHLVAHSSCASCLVVQCLSWVSLGVNQIFKWRCVCALTLNSLKGSAALLYICKRPNARWE